MFRAEFPPGLLEVAQSYVRMHAQVEAQAADLRQQLESARAQSRTSGLPVVWRALPRGFEFIGLPQARSGRQDVTAGVRPWLFEGTEVLVLQPPGAQTLVLGPEPLIPAQRLVLAQGERRLTLGTDGLGPFVVLEDAP